MLSPLIIKNFRLGNHMSNIYIIASIFICLAEQRLRGCKAWVERVMAEWLKTLYSVVSRDYLPQRWTLPESLWVSSNKTHDGHIWLPNLKNSIKHFGIVADTGKVSNSKQCHTKRSEYNV
jgi:hypothetical protein